MAEFKQSMNMTDNIQAGYNESIDGESSHKMAAENTEECKSSTSS
jgi:hypothetical protein